MVRIEEVTFVKAEFYRAFKVWHLDCSFFVQHRQQMVVNPMRFNPVSTLDRERDQDIFESVTEEEIIYLWRSIKGKGLSEDEAWQAIVTGIALDMAFAKTKATKEIEQ